MKHNTFYRNLVRFIIAVGLVLAVYNKMQSNSYPETMDERSETSHSLDIPICSVTNDILTVHRSLSLEDVKTINSYTK